MVHDPAAPAVLADQPTPVATDVEAPPGRGTAARVVLVIVGVVVGIVAFALLVGGCALVAVDQTQRDDDGFLMSPTQDFASPTYAIISESADIDSSGGEWALDTFLGTVRIRSESERPLFVGIGPAAEVDRYLDDVERDVVDDLDSSGDPEYARRPGGAPSAAPRTQTFWAASSSGVGEQPLELGSRGRRLARSGDERRRIASHRRRHEHRRGARLRPLDRHRAVRPGRATRGGRGACDHRRGTSPPTSTGLGSWGGA